MARETRQRNSETDAERRAPRSSRLRSRAQQTKGNDSPPSGRTQRKGRATFTTKSENGHEEAPPGRRTPRSTRMHNGSSRYTYRDAEASSSDEREDSSGNDDQSAESESMHTDSESGSEEEGTIKKISNGKQIASKGNHHSSNSEDEDESASDNEDIASDSDSDSGAVRNKQAKNSQDPRASYYFVDQLDIKHIRNEEMMTRFRYLLGLGDLFREFVDYRAQKEPSFKALLDQATRANKRAAKGGTRANGQAGTRRSKANKLSDMAEVEDMLDEDEKITVFDESPGFIQGRLRQYQIDGLNWLISLFTNDINGILADEMGLGKTFQTIAFLAYLRNIQNIQGPHMVIAPKSTIQNWAREFATWTPEMEVLVIAGDKEERNDLLKNRLMTAKFDVCITSYELLIREKNFLKRIAWQYIIVDEAHRLKNEESILSKLMRVLYSRHRLLITGTPLQNNLHELWALLNFLLPDVFSDAEVFDEWFAQEGDDEDGDEEESKDVETITRDGEDGEEEKENGQVVDRLRSLLSPFLLRRVKRDVEHSLLPKKEINLYVSMSDMQIQWYQRLLEKDLDAINSSGKGGSEKKMRLLNIVMQLRKCCNHPYLFDGAEPGPPFTTDEHLVANSGKMILLDKLLTKLKAQGSRVLIFSQMSRMLDILEDFCNLRGYEYSRIDGSTQHEDRIESIDDFNRPGSDKFVFLLTTRAGGLGINLTTADQVIIYDSDWNPQADLQAMDRAHRIGQTKQVYVYRFIVEHAIEEKVLERAAHKLRLDQLVIQQGSNRNSAQEKAKAAASKEELADMIRHGAQEVFDKKDGNSLQDMSIDDLIASGEKRTQELNDKYVTLGLDELIKLTFDKPPSNQAPLVNKNAKDNAEDDYRHHHRRTRNPTMFSEDPISFHPHSTRAPKQMVLHDFQFYPPELEKLQNRELAWYRKTVGISFTSEDYSEDEEDESEMVNAEIYEAKPLSQEELELKESLVNEGFPNFSRRDLFHFFHLLVDFGGHSNMDEAAIKEMCAQWPEKPEAELQRYFKTFCERGNELSDIDRYNHMLEEGESKQRKQNERHDILKRRIESTPTPMANMRVSQPTGGSASKHRFTDYNDRFLMVQMYMIGLNDPDLSEKIWHKIRNSGLFQFDFYFMSRTPVEIGRRCTSLLNVLSKEENTSSGSFKAQKRKGRPPGVVSMKKNDSKRIKA